MEKTNLDLSPEKVDKLSPEKKVELESLKLKLEEAEKAFEDAKLVQNDKKYNFSSVKEDQLYLHNFVTAFFVTLSNPLIIFLFIGLFARFSFVMPGSPIGFQLVGYLAIVLGALLWWFGITYFVNKVRTRFNLRGIWILNRVIGIVVMLISVAGFIYTILGKTMY